MTAHAPITIPDTAAIDWIEHDGGDCPLPYTVLVQLRFRSGLVQEKPCYAGFWRTAGPRNLWRRRTGSMGNPIERSQNDYITHFRIVHVPLADVTPMGRGRVAA